jgi:hypothetical protein
MAECPCCGQSVPVEQSALEIGEDGYPVAASCVEGLGVPLFDGRSAKFWVKLGGERQDACVGYDRRRGIVWRNQKDGSGNYLSRGGSLVIEKIEGEVTLEPIN